MFIKLSIKRMLDYYLYIKNSIYREKYFINLYYNFYKYSSYKSFFIIIFYIFYYSNIYK